MGERSKQQHEEMLLGATLAGALRAGLDGLRGAGLAGLCGAGLAAFAMTLFPLEFHAPTLCQVAHYTRKNYMSFLRRSARRMNVTMTEKLWILQKVALNFLSFAPHAKSITKNAVHVEEIASGVLFTA